jgi:peptidyl-lysine (3S)-dioxygenase / protease
LKVPWISIDPLFPNLHKYPKYAKAKPIRCVVKPGEVLYIPSLYPIQFAQFHLFLLSLRVERYFHHVTQEPDEEGRVIAINFWYDMKFGLNYVYYKFLEACVKNSKTTK